MSACATLLHDGCVALSGSRWAWHSGVFGLSEKVGSLFGVGGMPCGCKMWEPVRNHERLVRAKVASGASEALSDAAIPVG